MATPLIVFDIGSTLVDGPAERFTGPIARALSLDDARQSALDDALMIRDLREPSDLVRLLHTDFDADRPFIDDVAADVWAAQEDAATPIPGAAEAITDLAEHGCDFAVVSNIWQPYLTSTRKHFGWFFDDWVPPARQLFSFREGHAKPSPELLRAALDASAVSPSDTIMIGDSYVKDMAPAISLGTRTIWLLHRPRHERKWLDRVLDKTAAVPSLTLESITHLDWSTMSRVLAGSRSSSGDLPTIPENTR